LDFILFLGLCLGLSFFLGRILTLTTCPFVDPLRSSKEFDISGRDDDEDGDSNNSENDDEDNADDDDNDNNDDDTSEDDGKEDGDSDSEEAVEECAGVTIVELVIKEEEEG